MNTHVRYYEIDLLRFVAAVMVVIFHYTFVGYMLGFAPEPRSDAINGVTRYFYLGINFFFVISGFVILMSAGDGNAKGFFISRFVRLYPAYWCAVILTSIAIVIFNQPKFTVNREQFFINLTMLQSGFGVDAVESAYWTLWVELKFYAIIFVMAWLGWLRYLPWLIATALVGSTIALSFPYGQTFDPFVSSFPHWWGYFACGCLLYLVRRDGLNKLYALLMVFAIIFLVKQNSIFAGLMTQWYGVNFNAFIIVGANLLFFLGFCIIALRDTNFLRRPVFYYLGVLTYPLYLVHQNIGYMFFNAFHTELPREILLLLVFAMALLAAVVIHYGLEKPLAYWLKVRLKTLLAGTSTSDKKSVTAD